MSGVPYPGPIPSSPLREAKYRIKGDDARIEVEMTLDHRTRAILSTQDHPRLVAMVNKVKFARSGAERGSFYINEYGHVLVPDIEGECWYAGSYDEHLEFDLNGQTIGPVAPPDLEIGQVWPGHRVGIPYTLRASGDDIYYRRREGQLIREVVLSDQVGPAKAAITAAKIARFKPDGGSFIINEASELLVRLEDEDGAYIVYAGRAEPDRWFLQPTVTSP